MMNIWCIRGRGALVSVAALSVAPSFAGNLDYQASVGAGHSDNVTRLPANELDEDIATAGLKFSFDEDSTRLKADVVGDLAYYDYLGNDLDSELLGNVYANSSFALLPDRILWNVSDQFGQVLNDPFQPATPENRENINYFSTGPDFVVGLGQQMRLRLGARYSLVDYEDSPLDSSNTGGDLSLIRVLSGRSSISFNARLQQVKYDEEALNADFDQTESYLRYEAQGSRTNLKLDAGYSQIDRDALSDKQGGGLLRVDVSRRISASSIVSLAGGREFSTAAAAFAGDQGITNAGLNTAPGRQTPNPFTLDRATLGWNFNRNVTGLGLTASWEKRTYDGAGTLDQSISMISGRFHRDLSPTTSLDLSASYAGVDYEPPAADYNDFTAGAVFSWRLTRHLTMDVRYDLYERSSDSPVNEYTENRFWLTIGYGHGDPRATRIPPTFGIDSMKPAD